MSMRKKECARLKAGSSVFAWILSQKRVILNSIFYDNRALGATLCWFIIGEGLEEYIWKYLKLIDRQESKVYRDPRAGKYGVRSSLDFAHLLLGGLSDACFQWSEPRSPLPSLLCFKRAFEEFPARSKDHGGLKFIGIIISIRRILERVECPPYDEDLFDLIANNLHLCHGPEVADRKDTVLSLYHPTRPDAEPFLQTMRQDRWGFSGDLRTRKTSGVLAVASNSIRASYILHHQGRSQDAAWLDSLVETKVPLVWPVRKKIWREIDNDRKLDLVRAHGRKVSVDDIGEPEGASRW